MIEADDSGGAQVESSADERLDPVPDIAAAPRGSSIRLSLLIAAIVVALDQLTKHWAVNALSDGRSRHVIWSLHWNLTFNSGMAFSRAQGIGPYIGAIAFVVVIAMVLSLRRSKGFGSSLSVGLVVGGALGNIIDRLFRGDGWLRGSVVDFIDFTWWPIFNVADMAVSIGAVLILLSAVRDSPQALR